MKIKIFHKLFFLTFGLISLVLSLQVISQYFLLEPYYMRQKEDAVSLAIEDLLEDIEGQSFTERQLIARLDEFTAESQISIQLSDFDGDLFLDKEEDFSPSFFDVENESDLYRISLDMFLDDYQLIDAIIEDEEVIVKGYLFDDIVYPVSIQLAGDTFYQEDNDDIYLEDEYVEFQGIITEFELQPTDFMGLNYIKEITSNELYRKLESNAFLRKLQRGDSVIYDRYDETTQSNYLFYSKQLRINADHQVILFASTSLQSIDEAVNVMNRFLLYIVAIAVLIALITTYFYSKKITQPIRDLNKVARQMAELNFDHAIQIKSQDEIGQLAHSIGELSMQLEGSLSDLKSSNAQLQKDLQLKEKTEAFRKRFIAHSSHELKTPLTILKGLSEGLQQGLYNRNDDLNYSNLLYEIDHMSHLVHNLLEISSLERDDVTLRLEPLQLSNIILKVCDHLSPLVHKKELKVERTLSDDFISGDPEKMENVIKNLIENAIRYTPIGGHILINLTTNSNQVTCYVENTPAHVKQDDLDKLWEPFYRVDKSGNKALGGTGLGLHLVKETLKKHHYKAFLHNTDQGFKIGFTAPLLRE